MDHHAMTSSLADKLDQHRRQRDLVVASLRVLPAATRPTHRRWAA